MDQAANHDPYAGCEEGCAHDLVRGVTIDDLLAEDGPYPTALLTTDPSRRRGWLLEGLPPPRLVSGGLASPPSPGDASAA